MYYPTGTGISSCDAADRTLCLSTSLGAGFAEDAGSYATTGSERSRKTQALSPVKIEIREEEDTPPRR